MRANGAWRRLGDVWWWETEISISPLERKISVHCSLDIFCFSLRPLWSKGKWKFCFDNKLFSFERNAPDTIALTMTWDSIGKKSRWCGVKLFSGRHNTILSFIPSRTKTRNRWLMKAVNLKRELKSCKSKDEEERDLSAKKNANSRN